MKKVSSRTYKVIFALVAIVLIVFGVARLCKQTEQIEGLQGMIQNLQNQVSSLNSNVGSISNTVEEQLKKQASLISGADFSIEKLTEGSNSVELLLTVVPKTILEDTRVSVTLDGKTVSLQQKGNGYEGMIGVDLFKDYSKRPLVSITSNNETKTEYLEDIDVSNLFMQYLPTFYADMFGDEQYSDGTLSVDLGFTVESKPASEKDPVTFNSFTLVWEVNGKEINRQDITNEVRKSGENYESRYTKKFKVSRGDKLRVYVIAEDSLGYIHKTLAHYWYETEDGAQAEATLNSEMIYDKDGNLLYGEAF